MHCIYCDFAQNCATSKAKPSQHGSIRSSDINLYITFFCCVHESLSVNDQQNKESNFGNRPLIERVTVLNNTIFRLP